MMEAARRLRTVVEVAMRSLAPLSDEQAASAPRPGKWSPKQVIGHLIDSASNNHQRFVRARFQEDLVFPGYDQDAWVDAQGYADSPWSELLALWSGFNLHLARVMESTPLETLETPRGQHNLDQIGWEEVPRSRPVTLEFFMRDYVGHLEHHLAPLVPDLR